MNKQANFYCFTQLQSLRKLQCCHRLFCYASKMYPCNFYKRRAVGPVRVYNGINGF